MDLGPHYEPPVCIAENVEWYREDGFHPVHLGDVIQDRYEIKHKLGHGSFSTVWLAKDLKSKTLSEDEQEETNTDDGHHPYVSIKVVAASQNHCSHEILILNYLNGIKKTINEAKEAIDPRYNFGDSRYVLDVLSTFILEGPNGSHQCIVTKFLGPSLATAEDDNAVISVVAGKRFAAQVARGLAFIHKSDVIHGDLNLGNLLLYTPSFDALTDADIEELYWPPCIATVRRRDGGPTAPHAPDYCVEEAAPRGVLPFLGLDGDANKVELRIVDFGEASLGLSRKCPGIAIHWAAPEVLLGRKGANEGTPLAYEGFGAIGRPSDMWTLGTIIYRLLTGRMVFYGCGTKLDRVLQQIGGSLGNAKIQNIAEQGGCGSRAIAGMEERLARLELLGDDEEIGRRIIGGLLKIDPAARLTAEEVVAMIPETWCS